MNQVFFFTGVIFIIISIIFRYKDCKLIFYPSKQETIIINDFKSIIEMDSFDLIDIRLNDIIYFFFQVIKIKKSFTS